MQTEENFDWLRLPDHQKLIVLRSNSFSLYCFWTLFLCSIKLSCIWATVSRTGRPNSSTFSYNVNIALDLILLALKSALPSSSTIIIWESSAHKYTIPSLKWTSLARTFFLHNNKFVQRWVQSCLDQIRFIFRFIIIAEKIQPAIGAYCDTHWLGMHSWSDICGKFACFWDD